MKNKTPNSIIDADLRKHFFRRLVLFLLFINLTQIPAYCLAPCPGINSPDTNLINKIVYPPLTERDGVGLNVPLPPAEHPRLFFRKRDIPALRKKVEDPLMEQCWARIIQNSRYETDGKVKNDGKGNNPDNAIRNAVEAKALLYAFLNDKKSGREAVNILLNYYSTLRLNYKIYTDIVQKYHTNVNLGRTIQTGAMVYDWCYDIITDQEKQILIGWMENMATGLEIEWPGLRQGSVVGHGSEAQLATNMLACGIATYDEKPEIYNLAAGRIIAEFIPSRKFFYPAGYHHQGSSYGPQRYTNDMWTTFIFDRMGYPLLYGTDQAKIPYYWIYLRRPDGQYFRDGDDYQEQSSQFGRYWTNSGDELAGYYFNDPLLIGEALKQNQVGNDAIFDYLFYNTGTKPDYDKSDLPLTKYFKEPLGAMVARTGWNEGIESGSVVAFMKIGVYNFANHQHLDAGNFQLYYKGPLAIESGIYQGTQGGYGSDHFKNYMQRTIAHNSMLVYDPGEKFFLNRNVIVNDGGQQYQNRGGEPRNLNDLLKNDYRTGEVLAHYLGPDTLKPEISYLKGELSEAYSEKVKSFKRSFTFLNLNDPQIPAALIVFDRVVSSDKDFRKYWILHSVEEPVINENITTIKRSEKGYNGKMVNTTLLPAANNLIVNKIGGKGNEFTVFDKTFPDSYRNPERNSGDGAAWRTEISPKTPEEVNIFLNVIQVMDNSGGPERPLEIEKFETDKLVGVILSDRINLFSKSGDIIGEPLNLTITGKGIYKVFIADTEAGSWKVQDLSNKKEPSRIVENQNKILYFKAGKGKYLIEKD